MQQQGVVVGPPPQVAYVSFSAEINVVTTEVLLNVVSNIVANNIPEVYLMLSTPGGVVMNGMNLYNVLRAMPIKLTTHNVGNVDSIGNVVFLAGEKRYACKHSTFMFHGVGIDIAQGVRLENKLLRERLDGIEADHLRIGGVIEDRTKLDKATIAQLFLEARTKDAEFAVKNGFVEDIRDVQIPPGAPIVPIVIAR
jgi:ATP-dependent Clp protease protease subunit